ncbi:amidase [Paraburkholderia strydomiana]|uniref:amidase n=1 Tax=Paraburkholderia strydomiana TaxID=1245417 RepID=UPI0038B99D6D
MTSPSQGLVSQSAVELRRLIGDKSISPVELLDACIHQIEKLNPAVNAIAATCFDAARRSARAAEQDVMNGKELGLLHGLPLGVKDVEDTARLLTTYGSPMARSNVPSRDTVLVERLRSAGAILVAKTNVSELGTGANTQNPVWGATANPFNLRLGVGGSSGGSAVTLACDMLPVCTGSDTGGSLRIPASNCGVVGFRPSPGLVPNRRRALGWAPISVAGPMGRDVADAALQLAAIAGKYAEDPLSYAVDAEDFALLPRVDLETLRVGYTEDFDCCDVDENIRKTFRARVNELSRIVRTCEPLALNLGDVHGCFDVIRAENFVANLHAAYERDPSALGSKVRADYEQGAEMSLADCAWAQAEQTRIFRRFQSAFSRFDVVITPTTPVTPFPWREVHPLIVEGNPQENYYRWLALTYVVTLTRHPALSLPCGIDNEGMPFSLQIIGPYHGDIKTLAISRALERVFSSSPALCRPRPDLRSLERPNAALKLDVTAPPDFEPFGSDTTG